MTSGTGKHGQHHSHRKSSANQDEDAIVEPFRGCEVLVGCDLEEDVDGGHEECYDENGDEDGNKEVDSPSGAVVDVGVSCFHSVLCTAE